MVGTEELEDGIHVWSMKVEKVESMWVGIARKIEENDLLDKDPQNVMKSGFSCLDDAYVLAFNLGSNDVYFVGQCQPTTYFTSSCDNSCNQTVRFELDTYMHFMRMYIGDAACPIVTASHVDCRGVRPFVCMRVKESVTLLTRTCRSRATRSHVITNEDWCKGFDVKNWPEEVDDILIKHPLAGLLHYLLAQASKHSFVFGWTCISTNLSDFL